MSRTTIVNRGKLKVLKLLVSFYLFGTLSLQAQSITIDSFKINGEIPVYLDLSDLKSLIDIDSIRKTPGSMDALLADSLIYIGKAYFQYYKDSNEYFGGSKRCELGTVEFNEKIISVTVNSVEIDANTTIESFHKDFPDCKPELINVYEDDRNLKVCGLPIVNEKKEPLDSRFLFFFHKGKLVRIEYWIPT